MEALDEPASKFERLVGAKDRRELLDGLERLNESELRENPARSRAGVTGSTEPIAAYVSQESPLELTVNFGSFVGREAFRDDVDRLGEALLALVSGVTLFAGRRYEFARGAAEVAAYEVEIRFPTFILPTKPAEHEALVDKLLETVSLWARDCAARPLAEGEDLASRILRGSATED